MQSLLSSTQERILAYPTSYHYKSLCYIFNGNNCKALTLVLETSDHTHYCCKFLKKEMQLQESSYFTAALIIKYLYVLKICKIKTSYLYIVEYLFLKILRCM